MWHLTAILKLLTLLNFCRKNLKTQVLCSKNPRISSKMNATRSILRGFNFSGSRPLHPGISSRKKHRDPGILGSRDFPMEALATISTNSWDKYYAKTRVEIWIVDNKVPKNIVVQHLYSRATTHQVMEKFIPPWIQEGKSTV